MNKTHIPLNRKVTRLDMIFTSLSNIQEQAQQITLVMDLIGDEFTSLFSEFIWPFLRPYTGTIPNKKGLYFPNFVYFEDYIPKIFENFS